jgi:type IV secretory pathway VirB2 component (pilin)
MNKKIFYVGCLLVLFFGIGLQAVRADEGDDTCDTGFEGASGTCYANKADYCAAVTDDSAVCGCPSGYEGASGTCYATKADYCAAVSDDPAVCGSNNQGATNRSGTGTNGTGGGAGGAAGNTAGSSTAGGSTTFANPLKVNSIQALLTSLLSALQGLVAIVAIIMIIVGGIMYMFAGVDQKMMENGKKTIGGAVIGLAIVFAAPAFLKEILTILGGTDSSGLLSSAPSLQTIAQRVLNLLLSIVGILGIIGLVAGGAIYLTAYGDEERIKKAKSMIAGSIMGIIIALAALVIVRQIANLLK